MRRPFKIVCAAMLSFLLSVFFLACDEDEPDPGPQPLQTGFWATPSDDVQFYISQQSNLDTLRVTFIFSGNCSGSMILTTYPVSITNRSFFKDIGSAWNNSTGSIQGTFSKDGKSCSGTYEYTDPPCPTISESFTATPK